MHRSLTWDLPGIEGRLTTLRDDFVRETPALSMGDAEKFRRWVLDIETIFAKAAVISGTVQPEVEADLGYPLGDREQFVIAMFRPSTRNLFDEIAEHARSKCWCTLTDANLRELAGLSEVAGAPAGGGSGRAGGGGRGEKSGGAGALKKKKKKQDAHHDPQHQRKHSNNEGRCGGKVDK